MSWQRIQGHDEHRLAFVRAVERSRLAHAYLFVGPQGIGKRSFATELSKALLCEDRSGDLIACDQCPSCQLMDAGNHPDFTAVARPEDKNVVPIDVMRELCKRFSFKSARGQGKIGLLDDADDLDTEGANCFLKTLEEPPPKSVFFLIASSSETQLATIVSRCQVVRFRPLADEIVTSILLQQESVDAALIPRLVKLGQGSPGQAVSLADPELWAFRNTFIVGLIQLRPDTVALAKQLMKFVEEAGKEASAQRRRASQVIRLLVEFFDDALAVRLGAAPHQDDEAEMRLLTKVADRVDADNLLQVLERCLEADAQTGRYLQLVLVLEGLLDWLGVMLSGAGVAVRRG